MRMLEKSSDTLNCSRPRSPSLQEEGVSALWPGSWQGGHGEAQGSLPHSLLVCEACEVAPVGGEVLELEGVDGDEHQHGVGHHEPPEHLKQLPPQAVVDLQVRADG